MSFNLRDATGTLFIAEWTNQILVYDVYHIHFQRYTDLLAMFMVGIRPDYRPHYFASGLLEVWK